ncbi:CYTH4, partial [Symbiodinium microadriaticum]
MIEESLTMREGFLIKRGHIIQSWKKRYFILKSHELAYYTDNSTKVLKGVYSLDSKCSIEKVSDIKGRPYCFSLTASGRSQGGRYDSIIMQAESQKELEDWISNIKEIVSPRPVALSKTLSKMFADVKSPEEEEESKTAEVQQPNNVAEPLSESTETADPSPPTSAVVDDEIKTTDYDLDNFIPEGWALKREGEGGIYHNRYVWINPEDKTLHWAKDDDKYGPSKSISLAGCTTSEVKHAKQQRRASFVGTADTPGFSFSIHVAADAVGEGHDTIGLK